MNEELEARQQKKKKYLRMGLFVLVDIFIVIASEIAPLILRFGLFTIDMNYYNLVIKWLPIDIPIAIAVIAFFKLYNRVWAFASIEELIDCLKAATVIEAIYVTYKMLVGIPMNRSFYPFNWMILFLLLAGSRISLRLLRSIRSRGHKVESTRRLMIIGGGSAGATFIKELKGERGILEPICVIDDNAGKKSKFIHGVPIVGNRESIVENAEKYRIDEIVIAIPSAGPTETRDILKICQETHCKVKILPAIASTLKSGLGKAVRDVNYEDLLGREMTVIANPELETFIEGKTVMVTGGGGTIGSELCRQIIANNPGKLLIVDIYENTTYELEMELNRYYPEADKEVLIASVRDYDRLESIFKEYRPDIVYHAAAHKHVPLMEYSPNEAIKNNCKGTLNMAKLADKYGVKRFVLISTDKAVRPTNVMGATKRICEMIVQTYNRRSNTEFVAVRFGNVLGSNGSVIPLFLKQIEAGGPLTLTHKEITRFFMTIPEAVSLVLKAGLMAKGGEIFVLDMGEPVKIYDLAVNLIKMKGYVPEKDIKIEIVGLRPGEKLYEEILMDEEGLQDTANKMIHIGKPIELDEEKFLDELDSLIVQAEENGSDIKEAVKDICPTY
ncbi:MAG: nucleoside-diphosphate sugar epimerase/dehydratase, partial [Bacillota bacterium]|nr:nucleoside-diphosphate sugar epimerase/dehydratase [Bacillota bacterium]